MNMTRLGPTIGSCPSAVVHAGTGAQDALAGYLAADPGAIVVIEPDEIAAARLHRAMAAEPRVTVIHAALTPRPGPVTRLRFNFAELDSLSEPTGLRDAFPGLREKGRDLVPALPISDLVARATIRPGTDAWLIVDMPGEEAAIVADLLSSGASDVFATLVLRGATVPLYKDAMPLEVVERQLGAAGYTLGRDIDTSDPARPVLRLTRDEGRRVLEAEIAALKSRILTNEAEHAAERESQREALAALQARLSTAEAEVEAARTTATERTAALGQIQAERDSARAELDRQRETLESLQARLAKAEAEADAGRKVARVEVDALAAERDALQRKLDLARMELSRIEGQVDVIRSFLLKQGNLS